MRWVNIEERRPDITATDCNRDIVVRYRLGRDTVYEIEDLLDVGTSWRSADSCEWLDSPSFEYQQTSPKETTHIRKIEL